MAKTYFDAKLPLIIIFATVEKNNKKILRLALDIWIRDVREQSSLSRLL
jgi:hypothetical protein